MQTVQNKVLFAFTNFLNLGEKPFDSSNALLFASQIQLFSQKAKTYTLNEYTLDSFSDGVWGPQNGFQEKRGFGGLIIRKARSL